MKTTTTANRIQSVYTAHVVGNDVHYRAYSSGLCRSSLTSSDS